MPTVLGWGATEVVVPLNVLVPELEVLPPAADGSVAGAAAPAAPPAAAPPPMPPPEPPFAMRQRAGSERAMALLMSVLIRFIRVRDSAACSTTSRPDWA